MPRRAGISSLPSPLCGSRAVSGCCLDLQEGQRVLGLRRMRAPSYTGSADYGAGRAGSQCYRQLPTRSCRCRRPRRRFSCGGLCSGAGGVGGGTAANRNSR